MNDPRHLDMQVSKKRKLPLLLTAGEMEGLFAHLGNPFLLDVSRPVDDPAIPLQDFLAAYEHYISAIEAGKQPNESPLFSAAIALDLSHVYKKPLPNGRNLIRPTTPIIQMRRHHFIYSEGLHSGVMGDNSVSWGIEFSYPQLYLDPQTHEIGKVDKSFPNTDLFHSLVKWTRTNTLPTPFLTSEGKKNHPIRLGKGAFSFINNHPGLAANNLEVALGTP